MIRRQPPPLMNKYMSWGRYPIVSHAGVLRPFWSVDIGALREHGRPVLPYGRGRSYGDVCLNENGLLIDTRYLDRFISFDGEHGLLRCEAGCTFEAILRLIVPKGWFIPVVPGTRHITVGGAIANDIHGKNHHRAGTFGRFVKRLEILRSDGRRLVCSESENTDLFHATIGGLGLTGLVLWAEFELQRIPSRVILEDRIPFTALRAFFDLSRNSNAKHEYTVAWIDAFGDGKEFGRGVFIRGNWATEDAPHSSSKRSFSPSIPFTAPSWVLTPKAVKILNHRYYRSHKRARYQEKVSIDKFFFPLDKVGHWNRMYGSQGFLQYQCVLPPSGAFEAVRDLLVHIKRNSQVPFLSVLKAFGNITSPGMLSFPREGVTMALDFKNYGSRTLALLDDLDHIVSVAGGAIYPAKDSRMSPEMFRRSCPELESFIWWVDPAFSSSFWRRVIDKRAEVG